MHHQQGHDRSENVGIAFEIPGHPSLALRTARIHFHLSGSSFPVTSRPRLLVSVRNAVEALAAVRGGADIIDVKEPSAGSLGRAPAEAIAEIVEILASTAPHIPGSVALGELIELSKAATMPSIPAGVRWLKMGLSGCGGRRDWCQQWMIVREAICPASACIAVAYVDAEAADAPPLREVLAAAIETRCAGLLLDTFSKGGGTLLDAVTTTDLIDVVQKAQAAGLLVALAGRLRRSDLPAVLAARPDVVAVRSAVCRDQNRTAVMEESLVKAFRQAMIDAA